MCRLGKMLSSDPLGFEHARLQYETSLEPARCDHERRTCRYGFHFDHVENPVILRTGHDLQC